MKKVILILGILLVGCSSDDHCECDAVITKVEQTEWEGNINHKFYSRSDCYDKFDNVIFTTDFPHAYYYEGECVEYNDINQWF